MADLTAALEHLRATAGNPSLRTIEATSSVSRSTLCEILRGRVVPTWPTLCAVVVALGGDPNSFAVPWREAQVERIPEPGGSSDPPQLPPMLVELRAVRALMERVVELLEERHG